MKKYQSLKDVYSGIYNKHNNLVNENILNEQGQEQGEFWKQVTPKGKKGITEPRRLTPADKRKGKDYVVDQRSSSLSRDEIDMFNDLDINEQQIIRKYISTKFYKNALQDIYPGVHDELKTHAHRLLLSDPTLSDSELVNFFQQIASGKNVVDISKLTTPGQYDAADIFKDDTFNIFKSLKQLGTGRAQAGPGEAALELMSPKHIQAQTDGDISIDGEVYELKMDKGRIAFKAGPQPSKTRALINNTLNENITESLSLKNFVALINAKLADKEIDSKQAYDLAANLFNMIFDDNYGDPVIELFKDTNNINEAEVIKTYIIQCFNMYKDTVQEWDKIIGISTKKNKIYVVSTGEELYNAIMQDTTSPSLNVISTKSGPREYWPMFPAA